MSELFVFTKSWGIHCLLIWLLSFTCSRMSLSSSAILDWYLCNFPWFFDWRHFPPKVYGRERFDLPHQQQDYILRPRESICWNSPCLISPAQRPIEDITYTLFGYLALNEQPLLARLRPAGGTERIVVIATKQFVLCKSIWPDFTLTFRWHIPVLFDVKIGSRNHRKLSRSIEDFGLHDEIAPSNSNATFIVFS